MDVKGLSIKDIMSMDWDRLNRLSTKELKQVTSRLVSASNKRIRALEKATRGKYSYAYKTIEERGRPFSVRGKNVGQVKQEFKLAKRFLEMKTSTIKGWSKTRASMEQRVSDFTYGESQTWSEKTWEKYWEVYRKTEEVHGGSFKKGDSDRIQQKLYQIFAQGDKRRSADYFSDLIESKYDEMYEKEQETEDETNPFEMDEENDEDLM